MQLFHVPHKIDGCNDEGATHKFVQVVYITCMHIHYTTCTCKFPKPFVLTFLVLNLHAASLFSRHHGGSWS